MSAHGVIVALGFMILWSCAEKLGPSKCWSCHGECKDRLAIRYCIQEDTDSSINRTTLCMTRNILLDDDKGVRDLRSCYRSNNGVLQECYNNSKQRCIMCYTDLCNSEKLYNYTKRNSTRGSSYPDAIFCIVLCIMVVFTMILK